MYTSAAYDDDYFDVCGYLGSLNERDTKQLGGALGLGPAHLSRMKNFPGRM